MVPLADYLKRHVRLLAFLLLLAVTIVGLQQFFGGEWRMTLGQWKGKIPVFCLALSMQFADASLDSVLWMILLREFGIRPRPRLGYALFWSGYAGLLLPLQLGRFIRADALGRLGLGRVSDGVRAELVQVYLIAVAAAGLLAGVVGSRIHWVCVPLCVAAVYGFFLLSADRLFVLLAKTPVHMPKGFWRRKRVVLVGLLSMTGWCISGTSLYLMVHGLPGDVSYWEALLIGPANQVLGLMTGLPGGIGAVEGFLGVSLSLVEVPKAHLALAVAAFRIVTFWAWIPVGWLALTYINRRVSKLKKSVP